MNVLNILQPFSTICFTLNDPTYKLIYTTTKTYLQVIKSDVLKIYNVYVFNNDYTQFNRLTMRLTPNTNYVNGRKQ